jgi:DUF1707 SHOCT-like domain/Cell wall-active antibiotics response LiaF, C-terminal
MSDPQPPSGPSPERGNVPELRASDIEREQAVEVLRAATAEGRLSVDELEDRLRSAYTVPTRRELELLIADVSVDPLPAQRSAPVSDSRLTVREGPGGSRWVISIMSGHDRRGRWRIADRCNVLNIMGGSDIDLNDAELSQPVTQINIYSIMGGGEIRVPHGVDVQVSDIALMGGNDIKLGDEVAPPGAPQIRIRLVSIMSGVSVRRGRKPSREERRRQKELRRAERRGELEQ